jgi:hypothetical protein
MALGRQMLLGARPACLRCMAFPSTQGLLLVFCYACEAWSSYLLLFTFLVRSGEACHLLRFGRGDDAPRDSGFLGELKEKSAS